MKKNEKSIKKEIDKNKKEVDKAVWKAIDKEFAKYPKIFKKVK